MVKNPLANGGDKVSVLDPGRSHMLGSNGAYVPQLLNLHASTTKAHALWSPRSAIRETTTTRSLCTPTRE